MLCAVPSLAWGPQSVCRYRTQMKDHAGMRRAVPPPSLCPCQLAHTGRGHAGEGAARAGDVPLHSAWSKQPCGNGNAPLPSLHTPACLHAKGRGCTGEVGGAAWVGGAPSILCPQLEARGAEWEPPTQAAHPHLSCMPPPLCTSIHMPCPHPHPCPCPSLSPHFPPVAYINLCTCSCPLTLASIYFLWALLSNLNIVYSEKNKMLM
jgi:hypothetical protein